MAGITVRAVKTAADLDAFIAAGHRGQAGNRLWAAPLHHELHTIFAKKSAIMRENDVSLFVALRDGEPVGRIAAIVNPAHLARYQDKTGHFGMIEAIDEEQVFGALFDAACARLRERGMARVAGPFSLTINHETGLLVHGFDEPHVVRTNHAPPFYAQCIEALGFRKAMDVQSWALRPSQAQLPERLAKLRQKFPRASEIRTQGLSFAGWAKGWPAVMALYNDAWNNNWGAIPVSVAEATMIAKLMLPVTKPAWIRTATWNGEPIALLAQIPDVNEAMRRLDGKLMPFGWADLMWQVHVKGTRMSRIPLLGIASRWLGTGIGSMAANILLVEAIEQARRARIEEIEISWILETNHAMLNTMKSLPARHSRTFRIYEREL